MIQKESFCRETLRNHEIGYDPDGLIEETAKKLETNPDKVPSCFGDKSNSPKINIEDFGSQAEEERCPSDYIDRFKILP